MQRYFCLHTALVAELVDYHIRTDVSQAVLIENKSVTFDIHQTMAFMKFGCYQ